MQVRLARDEHERGARLLGEEARLVGVRVAATMSDLGAVAGVGAQWPGLGSGLGLLRNARLVPNEVLRRQPANAVSEFVRRTRLVRARE